VFELLIKEALATANPWKDAVQAASAVDFLKMDDHDPMGALSSLVRYNQKLALDPAVSAEAVALRDTYLERAERAEQEYSEVVHSLQINLQPDGSPIPGGRLMLALWIIREARLNLAAQANTIKLLGRLGRAGMCIPTTDDEVAMLVDAKDAALADPATAAVLNHDTERNDHGV